MAKGLKNWAYADVIDFLKRNGFVFYKVRRGSHEAWINFETNAVVEISFHGNNVVIPTGTFDSIVRQSKIPKKLWRAYGN